MAENEVNQEKKRKNAPFLYAFDYLASSKGYSQKELAERAKISQSFLCDIEQGRCKPSIDTAVKLAEVLEITDIKFWDAK